METQTVLDEMLENLSPETAAETAEAIRQEELKKVNNEIMHILAFMGEVYTQRDFYLAKLNEQNTALQKLTIQKQGLLTKIKDLGGTPPTFELDLSI